MAGTGVPISAMPGLITDTLQFFVDKGVLNAQMSLQDYWVFNYVLTKKRMTIQDGRAIEYRIIDDSKGLARHANPHEKIDYEVFSTSYVGTKPWAILEEQASWDGVHMAMQGSASKITDHIMENKFLGKAAAYKVADLGFFLGRENAADVKTPDGLLGNLAVLPAGTTNDEGGHIGTTIRFNDGTSQTTRDGIDLTSKKSARNFAATKSGMNPNTLDTLYRALVYTKFEVPSAVAAMIKNEQPSRTIFMAKSEKVLCDNMLNRTGSDGRNQDLRPFKANMFAGIELMDTVLWDNHTMKPIVGVDWSAFHPAVLAGMLEKPDEVRTDRANPRVFSQLTWTHYNYFMDRPNRCFILHEQW